MDDAVIVVLCTAPADRARDLADRLLEERLVACANMIGPVVSRYHWRGAIEESEETVILFKSRAALRERLRRRISELHPYEVPEVLELDADGGLEAYLAWVRESCPAPEGNP